MELNISAAAFFCTYEATKAATNRILPEHLMSLGHMTAASFGEVVRKTF